MGNTYTTKFKLRKPGVGDTSWADEMHDNVEISEVMLAMLSGENMVLSGGAVTDATSNLYATYAAVVVQIGGAVYSVAGSTTLTTGGTGGQKNWIYINSSGALTTSTTAPTGDFVALALVDSNVTTIDRIADLRVFPPGVVSNKNILINPEVTRINQRAFAGTWSALSVGDFGYDRWSVSSTGYISQKVESVNVQGGTYIISWTGGGTGSIGGTAVSSGDTKVLTAATQYNVIVPNTATNVKLERGYVVTPFVSRSYGVELALCQRYYHEVSGMYTMCGAYGASYVISAKTFFPVPMRVTPAMVISSLSQVGVDGTIGTLHLNYIDVAGHTLSYNWTTATTGRVGRLLYSYTASAEL